MDSYGFKNQKVNELLEIGRRSSGDAFKPDAKGNEFFKNYRDNYFKFLDNSIQREDQLEQKQFDKEMYAPQAQTPGQESEAPAQAPAAEVRNNPYIDGAKSPVAQPSMAEQTYDGPMGGGPREEYQAIGSNKKGFFPGYSIANDAINRAEKQVGSAERIAGLDYRVGLDQQYWDAKAKSAQADFFGDQYAMQPSEFTNPYAKLDKKRDKDEKQRREDREDRDSRRAKLFR